MDAFEVEHEFPAIGRRVMLLNARAVFYADHAQTTLLLAFEDVTERRAIEREKEELLGDGGVPLRKRTSFCGSWNTVSAQQFRLLALDGPPLGDILESKKKGRLSVVRVEHRAGVQEHDAAASHGKLMLDLERVHGGALRDDFLQTLAKGRNLPLTSRLCGARFPCRAPKFARTIEKTG